VSRGCLTAAEVSAFIERGRADAAAAAHLDACEACRLNVDSLENEVLALQYSMSGLWFRERVSCPTPDELASAARGALSPEAADYVDFHVNTLGCRACGAAGAAVDADANPEIRRKSRQAARRVTDSMGRFLDEAGKGDAPPP